MRTLKIASTMLAAALVAAAAVQGCALDPSDPDAPESPATEAAGEAAPGEERVLGWTFDTSALRALAAPEPPQRPLLPEAFDVEAVQGALLGSDAPFEPVSQLRTRERLESSAFSLEIDGAKGKLLALRREAPAAAGEEAAEVVEDELRRDALERLRAWGIPEDEVARATTRRLLGQDDVRGGDRSLPRLVAYKTFVMRGLGGVPVAGHRAVVTHDPSGELRKVLVDWPALAPSGHKLRTMLSMDEVKREVANRLTALGRPAGQATLRWVHAPSADASGAVTLTLKVAATLPAVDHGEVVEEPEVELIDVQASP